MERKLAWWGSRAIFGVVTTIVVRDIVRIKRECLKWFINSDMLYQRSVHI